MKKFIKALTAVAATGAGAGLALGAITDELLLNRNIVLPESVSNKVTDCDMSGLSDLRNKNLAWLEDYGYEKHYMENDRGQGLAGYLMKSKKPSDIYVLGIHGYRSSGKIEFCGFAQYYLKKGINVFFTDHAGAGESDGKYCSFGYYETDDCLKWLSYMKNTFGTDIKIILHGVSMGAATADMMCGSGMLPHNVKMAVSDCGYSSGTELFREKLKKAGNIIYAVDLVNRLRFGYGFSDVNPEESVKRASVPMLFVHGSGDTFVPYSMSEKVYIKCGSENKELLIIEGANHAQSWVDGQEQYEEKLDQWIEKYL